MDKAKRKELREWLTVGVSVVTVALAVGKCQSEQAAKIVAIGGRDSAIALASAERACRLEGERLGDRVSVFMSSYNAHLYEIKNAASRLNEVSAVQVPDRDTARIRLAKADLTGRVQAYVKFVHEWRRVHGSLEPLLDGDVTRMEIAKNDSMFAEVARLGALLERNAADKEAILREQVRMLTSPLKACESLR